MSASDAAALSAAPRAPGTLARAANLALYQAGWFAAVLGTANGYASAGTLATLALVPPALWLTGQGRRGLLLCAVVVVLGATLDTAQGAAGVLRFAGSPYGAVLAPPWLLALWALFATTLDGGLRFLQGRPWLAAAVGAVAGPLAYGAGAKLGAATLPLGTPGLLITTLVWTMVMPLLLWLARRLRS